MGGSNTRCGGANTVNDNLHKPCDIENVGALFGRGRCHPHWANLACGNTCRGVALGYFGANLKAGALDYTCEQMRVIDERMWVTDERMWIVINGCGL